MPTSAGPMPALTTTFEPEESCINRLYELENVSDPTECFNGSEQIPCHFLHLGPISSTSAYYPPDYQIGRSFYYSPGICPSGYSLACSNVVGKETRGTCCPTWYTCNTDTTEWFWYTTDQCTWVIDATVTYKYVTSTIGGDPQTSVASGPNGANALGIAIRYKQDDFPSKTSSASSTSAMISGTASSDSNTASTIHSGLGTGAKAGIAVGAVIAGLSLLGLLVVLGCRRRNTRSTGTKPTQPEVRYAEIFTQNPRQELEVTRTNHSNKPYYWENHSGQDGQYDNHTPSELQ